MSGSLGTSKKERIALLPDSQQRRATHFLADRAEKRSRSARFEEFLLRFFEYGNAVDLKKYARRPNSFPESRFKLISLTLPYLYGTGAQFWDEVIEGEHNIYTIMDAAFAYILAYKDLFDENQERWSDLGIVAFEPDFKNKRLLVEQLQGAQGSFPELSRARRHIRLRRGEQPNITEVLFDIARGLAQNNDMRIAIRPPEESWWPDVQDKAAQGVETPPARVIRKLNLRKSPNSLYLTERH